MGISYDGASSVTGPLQPTGDVVRWRRVLAPGQRAVVAGLGALHAALVLAFITYLLWPSNLPALAGLPLPAAVAVVAGVVMVVALQVLQLLGTASGLHFAFRGVDPVPMRPATGLRVAMLTTIVPSKEPWEVAERTLVAFLDQRHDLPVDAWVLDEGDDPHVRARCAELGIHHFSRKGVAEWNTASGPFRAKTKHGNHNAWRAAHEHRYDVVTQMDPDHVPLASRDVLERLLGYFADPDVAYVVAPQVYGNQADSIVARGAAQLAYLFHGVIQRGANALGAPLLIGTNHAFRPAAWQQIDGYQDCIIEDHLTAMVVPTATNPATGRRWKGVYTPDVVTVGEGPTSWTDFFSQQRRWAYGIVEIVLKHSPHRFRALTWDQRVSFASLQFFYPAVGATWVLGNVLSALYLVLGVTVSDLAWQPWLVLLLATTGTSLGSFFYLRRFNLVEHERRSWGMAGLLLNLVTTPVYLAAAVTAASGRSLAYKVTAKGRLTSGDSLRTFRLHLGWAAFAVACMLAGIAQGHTYAALYVWMTITLATALAPVALWWRTASADEAETAEAQPEVDLASALGLPPTFELAPVPAAVGGPGQVVTGAVLVGDDLDRRASAHHARLPTSS
ncbi:glycosyltransferase family 2 protein [Pseudokineococcus marinus]|uniref:Glycosyltransferase n=1 Tax=Pseudokineococcus marinus TaxID=351215 RepID=A0A849BUN7_9ACTN|nr:glycosyltransferase family 2 protein [Pseudokineococcus marinus]NNH23216.1 glycosyltransferase [Pseudokineococcus marinus]